VTEGASELAAVCRPDTTTVSSFVSYFVRVSECVSARETIEKVVTIICQFNNIYLAQ
jgi:hypothetical protein